MDLFPSDADSPGLYRGWPLSLRPVNVLSYGAGQDSTAVLLLVLEDPRFALYHRELIVVFADTQAEAPETYETVEHAKALCAESGVRFEHLRPVLRTKDGAVHDGLEAYCLYLAVIPAKRSDHRWCTDRIKIQPIHRMVRERFAGRPVNMLIGFGAEELPRRDKTFGAKRDRAIRPCFPLVDAGMCRHRCVEYIRASGRLPVPVKSGCFFCPFSRKAYWKWLATRHPDLFERAASLEERGRGFGRGFYLSHRPLRELVRTPDRRATPERCVCGGRKGDFVGCGAVAA